MCTLTWQYDQHGLRIYFNRDEKRTRLPARPPVIRKIQGVRVLAPVDGNAGGTWLAVNEYGLAVAILNYYEAEAMVPPGSGDFQSRGQLVLDLAASRDGHGLIDKLHHLNHHAYRPYILAVFTMDQSGVMARWNGLQFSEIDLKRQSLPVTTSSFRTEDVLEARKKLFQDMLAGNRVVTDDLLLNYHRSRSEKGGAYAVTMSRPDACTVSFNKVTIGNASVSFLYEERDHIGNDPGYLPGVCVEMPRS